MSDDDPTPAIGPGYAGGQLAAALRAAEQHDDPAQRERAAERASRWIDVLRNLASGALRAGQREPYAGMPVWATPIIVRGGFATGGYAAGGPLAPHEVAIAGSGDDVSTARRAANGAMLSGPGRAVLRARLADRRYRVDVPEEAALLVVEWLIARGERESAAQLLDAIEPYFDRLRFHGPSGTPLRLPTGDLDTPVLLRSGHAVAESLQRKKPQASVEAMREAVEVWAPLTDAFVALFLETAEGELPGFTVDGERRRATGRVCVRVPAEYSERRERLLSDHAAARAKHTRCKRPHRRGEVLETLHRALAASDDPRALPARLVAQVRERLAGFVTAYGAPGSERHARLRASQVVGPSHARIGYAVAERILGSIPEHDGIAEPDEVLGPLSDREARRIDAAPGHPIPLAIGARVSTAQEATITTLIERGLVGSGEVLATLLPQLSGDALALRFDGDDARALYAASYRAFRRRRGLLLLWLQHQVRFAELPWIAALEVCADRGVEDAARACLRSVTALALRSFPATITPNKLVTELSALAAQAGVAERLPLVEEVASDIFMGTFSAKFLRAAQIAARVLGEGSVYARYYGVPYARVAGITATEKRWSATVSSEFDALCRELAGDHPGANPRARNGTIIEAASILTTHNLAALVEVLELDALLSWREVADRTYATILDVLERRVLPERTPYRTRLQTYKNLAFAWRQMVFFVSRIDDPRAFLTRAREALDARSPLARERLGAHLDALGLAIAGRVVPHEQRLLGWVTGRPSLLGPAPPRS